MVVDGHGTGSEVEGDGAELRTAVPDSWGLMSIADDFMAEKMSVPTL